MPPKPIKWECPGCGKTLPKHPTAWWGMQPVHYECGLRLHKEHWKKEVAK